MGSDRVEEQESPSALFGGAIVVSLPTISLSLIILGEGLENDEKGGGEFYICSLV